MDKNILLCPIELAGHGKRFNEAVYPSLDEAVKDIYSKVIEEIDGAEYAIFGHSMGGLIAFELAHMLKWHQNREPLHLFFSGANHPSIQKEKAKIHHLDDALFLEGILKYGGIPEEFLKNEEFLKVFLPIIRADYRLIERYEFAGKEQLFDCNITLLNGLDDTEVSVRDCHVWQQCTTGTCSSELFQGGHFFVNEHTNTITSLVNQILLSAMRKKGHHV